MEDWIIGVLLAMAGGVTFMIGQRFQFKNQTYARTTAFWKEEADSLRQEVRRYRAKAWYFQKGAVPSELREAKSPQALVEGIIDALPANYRMLLQPFKSHIVELAKDNPDLLEAAPALIAKFLGDKKALTPEQENPEAI